MTKKTLTIEITEKQLSKMVIKCKNITLNGTPITLSEPEAIFDGEIIIGRDAILDKLGLKNEHKNIDSKRT